MILEVCTCTPAGVRAAAAGGAARVELCSALGDGGVTPSPGLISEARIVSGLRLHVLIRPRGGDFVYDSRDVRCMAEDVRMAVDHGVDGIVIGSLHPDGTIDTDTCATLIDAALSRREVSVTFHRAFDMCRDPFEALETIISLGCDRILTSGLAPTALDGMATLRQLNLRAGGRIIILPGGGVSPYNAAAILRGTGCRELHGSLRSTLPGPMTYRRPGLSMGTPGADEFSRTDTSEQLVRETVQAISTIQ